MTNLHLRERCLRKHGLEMALGLLVCADTGAPVANVLRWSEQQARRDAHAWAAVRGLRIVDAPRTHTPATGMAGGEAPAATPTPRR